MGLNEKSNWFSVTYFQNIQYLSIKEQNNENWIIEHLVDMKKACNKNLVDSSLNSIYQQKKNTSYSYLATLFGYIPRMNKVYVQSKLFSGKYFIL